VDSSAEAAVMAAAWEGGVTADSEAGMAGGERSLLEELEDLAAPATEAMRGTQMEEEAKAVLMEEAKVGAAKEQPQRASP